MMLHWSTCNANLQRRFATHVSRTNLHTCYTFESLSKTCNTFQHCKYREKSFATGRYTKMIFRATSYHCKLALQVDQCNTTFRAHRSFRIMDKFMAPITMSDNKTFDDRLISYGLFSHPNVVQCTHKSEEAPTLLREPCYCNSNSIDLKPLIPEVTN